MFKVLQAELTKIASLEQMHAEDPGSQTLVVCHAHICTSVHMCKCVLAFARLDMAFVFIISIH